MTRITIFGSPGSGKSELAERLGAILGVARVVHLDGCFWGPGWTRTTIEERLDILKRMTTGDSWIIEGNFFNTSDFLIASAKTVIVLNAPIYTCFWRIIKRRLVHIWRDVPEVAPGCPDRISLNLFRSLWRYHIAEGRAIQEKLRDHQDRLEVIVLNSSGEITTFLRVRTVNVKQGLEPDHVAGPYSSGLEQGKCLARDVLEKFVAHLSPYK